MEVVIHNGHAMTMSLLKSDLVLEENLLFPNPDDPLGNIPHTVSSMTDIDTGAAYRKGFVRIKMHTPTPYPSAAFFIWTSLHWTDMAICRSSLYIIPSPYLTERRAINPRHGVQLDIFPTFSSSRLPKQRKSCWVWTKCNSTITC
jgi:hypothetical protein